MTSSEPLAYAFARERAPSQFSITRYPCLAESWQFTRSRLQELREALALQVPSALIRTIVAAGSLGRMEASSASDADLIVVLHEGVSLKAPEVVDVHEAILATCTRIGLERPNPKGVFGSVCTLEQVCGSSVGKADEPLEVFGKRLLLLLETQPVWGDGGYEDVVAHIVARYSRTMWLRIRRRNGPS